MKLGDGAHIMPRRRLDYLWETADEVGERVEAKLAGELLVAE